MIDSGKLILHGSGCGEEQLKCRLIKSLLNDHENLWVEKEEEMENAATIGKSRRFFRLIKGTANKNMAFSKTVLERDVNIIHSQSRRLKR